MLNHSCCVYNTKKPTCISLYQEENVLFFTDFHFSYFETFSFIPAINFSFYFNIIQKNLHVLLTANYHHLKGLLFQYLGTFRPLGTLAMALHQQEDWRRWSGCWKN